MNGSSFESSMQYLIFLNIKNIIAVLFCFSITNQNYFSLSTKKTKIYPYLITKMITTTPPTLPGLFVRRVVLTKKVSLRIQIYNFCQYDFLFQSTLIGYTFLHRINIDLIKEILIHFLLKRQHQLQRQKKVSHQNLMG